MLRSLNVFLASLGLICALSGKLVLPKIVMVVQLIAGAKPLAPGPSLATSFLLQILIFGLPLAWWVRSRSASRIVTAGTTGVHRAAHGLLGAANAMWLLSSGAMLYSLLTAQAAPFAWPVPLFWLQGLLPWTWAAGLAMLWWTSRRAAVPGATPTAGAMGESAAANDPVPRWLIALRLAVVLVCLPLTLMLLMLAFVAMLMARHSSGDGSLVLLAIGGLALVLPLGVFMPRRWPGHAFFHGLGALAAAVVVAVSAPNLWTNAVEPWLRGQAFERMMDTVQIGPQTIEPLPLGDVPAGVRTRVVFRLSKPIELRVSDYEGPPIVKMFSGAQLGPASQSASWPFEPRAPSRVRITRNGEPLAEAQLRAGATLDAGEYVVAFDTWQWGLRQDHGDDAPCLKDLQSESRLRPGLADARAVPLRVQAVARSESLGLMGQRVRTLEGATHVHAYDHAQWLQQLEALPVERCIERDARRAREREVEAQRKKFEDYLAGRSVWNDNPLYRAVCSHDPAEVRRVLALGIPRMNFSGMLQDCRIDASKPEIFDLMYPLAHARAEDRESYCLMVLERFLKTSDEASLRRLHRLGLPLGCAEFTLFQWLLGYSDTHPVPADERLPLLRRLAELGMDPCMTSPAKLTLLQRAVHVAPLPYIEFLLDAGCDPGVLPALNVPGAGPPFMSAQLAWMMRVRGYWANIFERRPERLPPEVVERLSRRIGEVSQEELTRVHPRTGRTGPLMIFRQSEPSQRADFNAALIAWMGSRGVRMDAADEWGHSWYSRAYSDASKNKPPKGHEMLDGLSVEQLRQMLKPVNHATGKSGKPLEAASDMSPGALGEYLCRRGAIRC